MSTNDEWMLEELRQRLGLESPRLQTAATARLEAMLGNLLIETAVERRLSFRESVVDAIELAAMTKGPKLHVQRWLNVAIAALYGNIDYNEPVTVEKLRRLLMPIQHEYKYGDEAAWSELTGAEVMISDRIAPMPAERQLELLKKTGEVEKNGVLAMDAQVDEMLGPLDRLFYS